MLDNIKAVAFDLDGTVYRGNQLIEGAKETIEFFINKKIKVFYVTNNSTKTRKQIMDKLNNMDLDVKLDQVITSGYIATIYAKNENLKNIYIFGSDNLKKEFEDEGIDVTDSTDAQSLLIGYDPDFTYKKLNDALQVALTARKIIACNTEKTFPGEMSAHMPGCGAMVAAIEHCSNRRSDYIIGKPNTLMLDALCNKENIKAEELLMVGDTYESDIFMAKRKGAQSILITNSNYNDTICVSRIEEIINLFG